METQSLTVLDPIYEGATTILYRGLRGPERSKIVLKTHRTEIPTARDLGRLRHEFAILQQIDVPGVVKPFALTTYKNHLALVLEDAPGRSLHTILRAGPLDLATALRVAIALCRILAALHDQHILHKDVKPQNILLDEMTGAVHLVDFGMATRLAQGIQRPSAPDALEGTLAYMAPEQTGRMNRVVDARSDLYSLGVTLYEMTTGVLPFMAADAMAMVHSHIARMPAPPRDLAPRLPQLVSDLILKLLAKAAEDRYQTARGLEADLAECLTAWEATGAIPPFPLGRHDTTAELRLPQKLYGRAHELEALVAAFGRARRGAAELLLVSGPSGVGKSALVHEVHKSIARGGGYFIEGKFDQLSRGVPYAPIARAFGDLCAQLMTERREALDRARERISGAVGAAGRVLTDLIPELARLLGPQPQVPAVGPTEAQSRFNLAFRALLGAVATADHPLVLFLDDLQWADLASLQLLHTLLVDEGSSHVLFVGAYRDAEVSAAHPLARTLAELRKAGAAISEVTLALLSEDDITELVSEALSCDPARGEALGRLIHRKTLGNPFFVSQLLGALRDEGLLRFDASSRSWQWSPEAIARHDVADNVVSLMVQRLERLAPTARRLVTLAACVGHRFDLTTLALIDERTPVETAAELWEALRDGLVLPLDDAYRLLHQADVAAPIVGLDALTGQIAYRFLHDRVQQAAYSLLDEADKPAVHLRIGRLLLAQRARGEVGDESLFDLVHHLGLGAARIEGPAERLALARLDLEAARRAKGAAAYEAASRYAEAGVALLGDALWAEEHALAFALHLEAAECGYLRGDAERAEALFGVLLARARAKHEAAQVHDLRMILCSTLGRYVEAIEAGRAALALFGIELPTSEEATQAATARELAAVPENLRGRAIEELLDAPLMVDPDQQSVASLLTTLMAITYLAAPLLCTLVSALNVNVSLKHGTAATTPFAYTTYGFTLVAREQRYDEAYAFGEVGLALNEKIGNASLECKLCNNFSVYTAPWKRPISVPLAYLERGNRAGLASGDLLYVGYNGWQISVLKLCRGDELGELRTEVTSLLARARQTGSPFASALQVIMKQLVEALNGATHSPLSLSSDGFDEAELLRSIQSPGFAMVECWYRTARLMLLYLHGDHAGALAEARAAEALAGSAVAMYFTSELTFFHCLALAAAYEGAPAEERPALDAELAAGHARLARWSTACPDNFEHKALLVAAEAARLSGDALGAMRLYDQAIASAHAHEFPHHAALACELAAGLYLGRDLYLAAGDYLTRAYQGYLRWGAAVKAARLLERHGVLFGRHATEAATLASATVTTTSRGASKPIDVATLSSAAEAIAGEIVLERLLARLMSIMLSNAGAQRGFLLAERAGKVSIEAAMTLSPDTVRVLPGTTLDDSFELSAMVVRFVLQSDAAVVLGNAAEEGRFAADPYIQARRPRSLLCMPVAHQGRSSGVLYLENNLAPDAFTKERVELLRLLSTHAAIAIENARLHAQSNEVSAALKTANARLEGEAELREQSLRAATAQLREANLDLTARTEELRRANDRLHAELAARAEAERARAELQEAVIRVQRERLEELSTPLIPITDQIVVMPLIGTMDAGRADQVLETALQGAQARRARVVIIDITGMSQVDAIVADKLMKTASALRLLGAQVALTGIRPDAARALVGLGVDMSGVATLGSLQSGIAYALGQTGRAGLLSRGADRSPSSFASLSPLGARAGRG